MSLYSVSGADFSDDEVYRYRLWRQWGNDPTKFVVFVMLNPSTADGNVDDPTIRRCIGFAKRLGAHRLEVVNLFAIRATDPSAMKAADDPVGPDNMDAVKSVADMADYYGRVIVCAWGAHGSYMRQNEAVVGWMEAEVGNVTLHCLGTTKAGHPRHPLYLPGDSELQVFEVVP